MSDKKSNTDALIFDSAELVEVPVKIGDQEYVLREASGAVAVEYRNMVMRCTKMVDGRATSVENLASVEPFLVHKCLFPKGENKHVSITVVNGFSGKVLAALYQRVREISGLDDKSMKDDKDTDTSGN